MKSMILTLAIVTIISLIIGGTVAGCLYLSGNSKIRLAEIQLDAKRIDAALDSSRMIARSYESAFVTVRRILLNICWVLLAVMILVYLMFLKMASAVEEMARISVTGGPKYITPRIDNQIDYDTSGRYMCESGRGF